MSSALPTLSPGVCGDPQMDQGLGVRNISLAAVAWVAKAVRDNVWSKRQIARWALAEGPTRGPRQFGQDRGGERRGWHDK